MSIFSKKRRRPPRSMQSCRKMMFWKLEPHGVTPLITTLAYKIWQCNLKEKLHSVNIMRQGVQRFYTWKRNNEALLSLESILKNVSEFGFKPGGAFCTLQIPSIHSPNQKQNFSPQNFSDCSRKYHFCPSEWRKQEMTPGPKPDQSCPDQQMRFLACLRMSSRWLFGLHKVKDVIFIWWEGVGIV